MNVHVNDQRRAGVNDERMHRYVIDNNFRTMTSLNIQTHRLSTTIGYSVTRWTQCNITKGSMQHSTTSLVFIINIRDLINFYVTLGVNKRKYIDIEELCGEAHRLVSGRRQKSTRTFKFWD